jgi:membrane protease YdiL (CAAX protease family)
MSGEPVNQPILPTPSKGYSEKTKLKVEVILSTFSTFAIVTLAAMTFSHISNDTVRMILRPLVYILLIGIPLILSRIMKNPIHTLGFRKDELIKQVLSGVGVFVAIELVFTIAVFALGDSKYILLPLKETRIGMIIYSIFSAMICAGMGEETLFRGYFMELIRTLTDSDTWAIVAPALMFGLWHFPSGQDFLQVIITALLGAIFGFARVRIKNSSTLSVGIAHGLHDIYILILSCVLL